MTNNFLHLLNDKFVNFVNFVMQILKVPKCQSATTFFETFGLRPSSAVTVLEAQQPSNLQGISKLSLRVASYRSRIFLVTPLLFAFAFMLGVGEMKATGTTIGTWNFTNGTTMPSNASQSGGAAFATSRYCFDGANDNIVITPTIPNTATTLYVVVKGLTNGASSKVSTITVSGLNSSSQAVSGASGTYTTSYGSASNATQVDNNTVNEDEISFSATNVAKIKIACTTYGGSKYIVRSVTISYGTAPSCSNSVTVTTPSATHGTISGATSVATCSETAADRQVTLTVTPSSGYAAPANLTLGGTITPEKVSGPTSNGAGAYTYVYQFAQNANGSTSFSATCPELQKYKVTFSTGTGNSTVNAITEGSVGSGITLPAGPSTIKCASDGWEFAGWSETEITSEASSATLLPAGNYKPSSDVTLYAVYRKASVAANATTVTYTLNGNWTTNNGNWTVIDGALNGSLASNKYGINSGSTSASSPVSITDISSITFSGTKSSSGAGTVAFYYGSGDSWTLIESKSFSTSLSWSPSPNVTGYLKCVFTRTNGNIYMASIGVTGKFPSYTYISSPDCCTELAQINGSVLVSHFLNHF